MYSYKIIYSTYQEPDEEKALRGFAEGINYQAALNNILDYLPNGIYINSIKLENTGSCCVALGQEPFN